MFYGEPNLVIMNEQNEKKNDMNTIESGSNLNMDAAITGEFSDTVIEEAVETPPVDLEPSVELAEGVAYLMNGAELPTDICIKSARKTYKVVNKTLRNPLDIKSWIGRRQTLPVGLCKKHYENFMVTNALAWSGLGVGTLLFVSGLSTFSIVSIAVGFLMVIGTAVAQTFFPVWAKSSGENGIEVHGLSPAYIKAITRE